MTADDLVSQTTHHASRGEKPVTQNTSNRAIETVEKRVAQLIGSRCMITCHLNGVRAQMLLDSGAQVSIVGWVWLKQYLPNIEIQPLESLLADSQFHVTAANGTTVPFDGWVKVLLEISSGKQNKIAIQVPLLVSQKCMDCPLLGFNVIEEIIRENNGCANNISLIDLLSEALQMHKGAAETLVSTVNSSQDCTASCKVKTGKLGVTIPRGQVLEVRCRVKAWHKGGTMMFEPASGSVIPEGLELFPAVVNVPPGASKTVKIPVQNSTNHNIYLPHRLVLGSIEPISEMRPVCPSCSVQHSDKQINGALLCSSQLMSADDICQRENS